MTAVGPAAAVRWYPHPADAEGADAARQVFGAAFGRRAEGVWGASGRVNLIGEHVDYNAGLCLPFALAHRSYAAIARREDDLLRIGSAQLGADQVPWQGRLADIGPGAVRDWPAYIAGVPWALNETGLPVGGFDVMVDSAVPIGAGLSSSAALECCVAIGLDELFGLGLGGDDGGRRRLAEACVRAENEIAGAPTGGMDQAAALRCSAGHALLLDCRDGAIQQLALDPAAAGLSLLVIDTRARHSLVDGQYGSRRELCRRAADVLGLVSLRELSDAVLADPDALPRALTALGDDPQGQAMARAARHVVTEIARVVEVANLLQDNRIRDIGPALDGSHRSLRDDYQVSCDELDVAVQAAVDAGALGARMTGGGFGGSAVALLPAELVDAAARAVAEAFAGRGFTAPAFLIAEPSGGANRIG